MASGDALYIPKKATAYRVTFPLLDADGDLVTGAASLDSEVSKDGGAFADCTNEATEIATSSGMYYLDLTSTEMDADTVAVIVKSSSAKTTPIVLYTAARDVDDLAYPTTSGRSIDVDASGGVEVGSFQAGAITAAAIATDAIDADALADNAITAATFASGAINAAAIAADAIGASELAADAVTEIQNGLATALGVAVLATYVTSHTGTAQAGAATTITLDTGASSTDDIYNGQTVLTIGGTGPDQARVITDYVGSTRVATVHAAWATNPSSDTTFAVLPNGLGSYTGSVGTGGITAGSIATDAIDDDALSADAVTAIQNGLATAAALNTVDDLLDTEIAAIKAKTDNLPAAPAATGDIPTAASIADAVWDEDTTGHTTSGTFGEQAKTDIDAILADTGTDGVIVATNNDKTGYRLSATGVDDILDESLTELAAVPAAAPTLRGAIQFLYQWLRNRRTTTSSATTIQNDAGSTIATATVADDGTTATKGEYA